MTARLRPRPFLIAALAAAAALALALAFTRHRSVAETLAPHPVAIAARPVPFDEHAPGQIRFGRLIWLGTLELTSPAEDFGGYSALALDAAGTRLFALSDTGRWLTGEIVTRAGKAERLVKATIGPLRGLDGRRLEGKWNKDAEALAFAEPGAVTGEAFIGFERRHRIAVIRVDGNGPGPVIRYLNLPADSRSAPDNRGIEALAVLRAGPAKGALLALTEEYLNEDGDHIGWLIGGPEPGAVALRRRGGFAITDAASLPGGDVVLLERRFRFTEGVSIRLRRIAAADIRAGALLDGEVLFETGDGREIDNMEGLAAHRDASGRTVLTLISDDNFNRFQRTLLIQFAIAPE